jgi:hypothetical protein
MEPDKIADQLHWTKVQSHYSRRDKYSKLGL